MASSSQCKKLPEDWSCYVLRIGAPLDPAKPGTGCITGIEASDLRKPKRGTVSLYRLHGSRSFIYLYPPSNFSYEMGRTWAPVQIASRDFFVQTGGVVPPILYLKSFCSWFLLNHAFSFCSCICWVSWSIQHKISLAFCSCTSWIVEASNIKSHLHSC